MGFINFLTMVISLAVTCISIVAHSQVHFKDQLQKSGILQHLKHIDHQYIATLNKERCKVYPIHVSRWVPSTNRYPAGVSCLCDWIITPNAFYGTTAEPKFIFVATRALYIFESIIDSIRGPFVLISAVNDETIPINKDVRIGLPQGFTGRIDSGLWPRLLNHPMILHWFAENHSIQHPKVSTLPIGFVSKVGTTEPDVLYAQLTSAALNATAWGQRTTLILSSDRVRDGLGQWHDRGVVHHLCDLHSLCNVSFETKHTAEQDKHEQDTHMFNDHVGNAKFLIMAHGGGLDPCPKLFHSIILGTIPIIESNALDDAFTHLPVAIVPSLADFLNISNLNQTKRLLADWTVKYAPYYEMGSSLRNQTLYRLSEEYWWSVIASHGPKKAT